MSSRISYTTGFKLKVVMFAKENGNRAAGCEFKVDEQCIRRWRGQEGVRKKRPTKRDCYDQGLKMCGSGAARKLLPANPHRKFVTISQEIFRVKSPMLCE